MLLDDVQQQLLHWRVRICAWRIWKLPIARGRKPLLIVRPRRNAPLGGPMLSKHVADPALRQSQLPSNIVDAGGTARAPVVSSCRLSRNHLAKRQIRDRTSKPGVLRLQILDPLDLFARQPAVLLAPAKVCDLSDPNASIASATDLLCCRSFATIDSGL
jgi:hypothetical protein